MAQYTTRTDEYLDNNDTIYEVIMMSDKDGNIINSAGAASNIPIATGAVEGYSHINKFGASDGDITTGTIWDGNSGTAIYPYPSNGVVSITSSSNSGASIVVTGLDANFVEQEETIAIGATGSLTFSRVFRALMLNTVNTSDVTINIGGSIAAKIIASQGQTLMAVYTVPADTTAYLLKIQMGSDKASTNASLQYTLLSRDNSNGEIFLIKGISYAAGGQNVSVDYPVPLKFTEKTDIRVDVLAASGGQTCSAMFDMVLVKNT